MTKIDKRVEIVRTSTKSLSSMSIGPSKLILNALRSRYKHVTVTTVNTVQDLKALSARQPDLCFLGVKQVPVSDSDPAMVWVSDFLDQAGLNYTGSTSGAMALEYNKQAAKKRVISHGLNTSKYFVGTNAEDLHDSGLKFPLFIKPTNLGNKKGVDVDSVVHDIDGYSNKIDSLRSIFNADALVEEYLPGREFSVAVIGQAGFSDLRANPIEAIVPKNDKGDRILGTNSDHDLEQVLTVTDKKLFKELCELAKGVFNALGARDYGRIDIKLDRNGVANFLEANLIPGLCLTNYFPTANKLYNSMDYDETILDIVAVAFARESSAIQETLRLSILDTVLAPKELAVGTA